MLKNENILTFYGFGDIVTVKDIKYFEIIIQRERIPMGRKKE